MQQLLGSESLLRGLVLPIVITVLNAILPFLFSFLARVERFKTLSGEIRMTLLRLVILPGLHPCKNAEIPLM